MVILITCLLPSTSQAVNTKSPIRIWLLAHNHQCLVNIIDVENHLYNPKLVGGLPQSQPASKMAKMGSDYATDWFTQIRWMIYYVNERYHGECNAWKFHQANGWY